jgi:hypothetical protein
MVAGHLDMRDASSGQPILLPNNDMFAGFAPTIQTSAEMHAQPTGADLVITARNTGTAAASLGTIRVGGINLGRNIEYFDFRATSDPLQANWSNYVASAWAYPNDLYSPVFVVRNSNYAVGISLQYPVMDYKHDVALCLANWGRDIPDASPGWVANFWMGNPDNHMAGRWGTLAPGESRTYVVSIRVTRNPQEWQTTLLPYRDYFRAHYGGVKYTRETTPIHGVAAADEAWLSLRNPFGFCDQRPDLNGWRGVLDSILNVYGDWPAVMIWAPSGLYLNHKDRNYPYQFTTHWNATPQLETAYDPVNGLPSLVTPTRKLGLWWGRSAEVSTTWDTEASEPFDPDNPAHVQAAIAEMDGAARVGATLIGLDTFMHDLTPVWKAYGWILQLEQRYPTMKFCTETSGCDIMHTVCPTFVPGWRSFASQPASTADLLTIKHPNYLADFINPGHEMWGQLSFQELRHWFHTEPSATLVTDQTRNIASYGYRPVVSDPAAYATGMRAAQSWETSLPASIRDSDPYIADIRAGRLPGQNGSGGGGSGGGNPSPPSGQTNPPPPPSTGPGAIMTPPTRRGTGVGNVRSIWLHGPAAQTTSNPPSPTQRQLLFHLARPRITPVPAGQGLISHYVVQAQDQP